MKSFFLQRWVWGVVATVGFSAAAQAAMVNEPVQYRHDGVEYEGVLVYDNSVSTPRPGVLMAPNWMGVNAQTLEKAARVAGQNYVVFVADLYGAKVRPSNAQEAGAAAGALRQDRAQLRQRMQLSLDTLKAQAGKVPLDDTRLAAIGFCFGGTAALELARSGVDLPAVVSLHGNLDTPQPAQPGDIKGAVLVLNGADDPVVPPAQIQAFEAEMRDAKVDWQFVNYGNAVHSFTNPYANTPGRNHYHPVAAARAFQALDHFLAEAWQPAAQ